MWWVGGGIEVGVDVGVDVRFGGGLDVGMSGMQM